MNELYLRLDIMNNKETIEVIFDSRLSLENNFKLLKSIYPKININNFYIFDKNENIFLDKTVPLKEFKINNLSTLCVF